MGQVVAHPASSLLAPEMLRADHPIGIFNSRSAELNAWFVKRSLHNAAHGYSKTYVVCTADGSKVVGYYCLASGGVKRVLAVKKMQRNAPDPIPVMVLGRLAVDQRWERQGIGEGMLREAILRSHQVGQIAGVAALLAHCLDEQAKSFYHKSGFKPSPLEALTMMLSMAEIEAIIG